MDKGINLITKTDLSSSCLCESESWMPRLAFSPYQSQTAGDVLLVVFLRGAADALNMIVPHGESAYYQLRPTLGIPRPDDNRSIARERAIDLDGFFGMHPAMNGLMPAWESKHLAVVHACGAPDESRSHFVAMELMERGVNDERGPASGWIARHLATLDTNNLSPLRAVGVGKLLPRSLRGPVAVSSFRSITDFHLGGDANQAVQMRSLLASLYSGQNSLDLQGRETLEIVDILQKLQPARYEPARGATYPEGEFGLGLRQVAMLVKAQAGLEVAAIDLGGWDTHFAQGGSTGLMAGMIRELSDGLGAIYTDLYDHLGKLSIVVMTEFGRRARENGSLGTDHGHGGLILLMGGNLRGGEVHARWPGLSDGQLIGPGDLAASIDYRDILGELCAKRLNNDRTSDIFPGYQVESRGIFR